MSIWDAFQEIRMRHVAANVIQRDAKVSNLADHVSSLEGEFNADLHKLASVCEAMWSLIEENTDLTQEDLESKIHELETLDGILLEEIEDSRKSCPRCNAAIPATRVKCQFCGYEL